MSVINEDKAFLNFHTSIGGHLGFGHFMDTRGKIELGTTSKIAWYLFNINYANFGSFTTKPTIHLIFATYPPHYQFLSNNDITVIMYQYPMKPSRDVTTFTQYVLHCYHKIV